MRLAFKTMYQKRYFMMGNTTVDPKKLVFTMPLTNLEGVKVVEPCIMPPGAFAAYCGNVDVPVNLFFVLADEPKDVWIAAALQGFRGMPASGLPRLMSKRRMRFKAGGRPTREKDVVLALVRDILQEGATDEVLAAAWAAREAKDQDDWKSVLDDPSALDKLEVSLEVDDYEAIKESTMARHARKSAIASSKKAQGIDKSTAPATALPGPAAPIGDGAIDSQASWTVRPLPSGDEDIELVQARLFLPRRKGVGLTKDTRRFSRWSGVYPRQVPPTHCTRSWGPMTGQTVASALRVVLRQLWSWHTEETGEQCPHDLSAEVAPGLRAPAEPQALAEWAALACLPQLVGQQRRLAKLLRQFVVRTSRAHRHGSSASWDRSVRGLRISPGASEASGVLD